MILARLPALLRESARLTSRSRRKFQAGASTAGSGAAGRGGAGAVEPVLSCLEAPPARNRRRQIGLRPLRMTRRLLKLGELGEGRVHEARDLLVALRVFGPIVNRQDRTHGPGLDGVVALDEL